jgi:septal ring factor EnvC (AmiA/AmiB activator)
MLASFIEASITAVIYNRKRDSHCRRLDNYQRSLVSSCHHQESFEVTAKLTTFVASLVTLLWTSAALAQATTTPISIAEMQKKLASVRNDVEQLLDTQADIYDQLDKVEAELELSSRLLRELRSQSHTIGIEIEATRDTIGILKQQSSISNITLAMHLRALYKQPQPEDRFLPFATTDGDDVSEQDYLFRRLITSDKRQLVTINSDLINSRELLASLRSRQQSLADVTTARQAEEVHAREAVKQRDRLLAQVKGQQREKVRQLEEIDKSAQTIGDIFEQIESERRQTVDAIWQKEHALALRLKGRLNWPVNGGKITGFGLQHESDGRLLTKSNGFEIATRSGAKVVAAGTGEVLYIGWARGLERFVVVDHGGSIYSLYGNLDEVSVSEGDQVIRGEQFATAIGPRLHFEIRDGKTAVDPADWLRQ